MPRKNTKFEERVQIAKFCIEHEHDYVQTAEEFGVSLHQAQIYTAKYEEGGEDALKETRGRRRLVE